MTPSSGRRRLGVAGLLSVLLLLAPFLFLRTPPAPSRGEVLAAAGPLDADRMRRPSPARATRSASAPRTATTTSSTAPPPTVAPAAAVRHLAAAPATPTTTRPAPRPTTTTAPPKPAPTTTAAPITTAAPPPSHVETGEASWYRGPDGECAHNRAPIGSTIRVVNVENGRSTTCRVTGRGPYGGGRVVDLTKTTFARVADPAAGVFAARVEW